MYGVPYFQQSTTLSTNATGRTSAFKIRGDGVLRVHVICPDTTSADGEFSIEVCDTETGTFVQQDVPELSKVAGAALGADMVLENPGGRWAKVLFTRTSGGAADEATLNITCD